MSAAMDDFEFSCRQSIASAWLSEPITCWWLEHVPDCPADTGGECACGGVLFFGGTKRVVAVNEASEVVTFTKV